MKLKDALRILRKLDLAREDPLFLIEAYIEIIFFDAKLIVRLIAVIASVIIIGGKGWINPLLADFGTALGNLMQLFSNIGPAELESFLSTVSRATGLIKRSE